MGSKLPAGICNIRNFCEGYTPEPRLKGEMNGHGDGEGLEEGGRGEWEGVRLWPRKKKEKSAPMSDVVIVTKLQPPVDSGLISSRRLEIGIGLNVAGIEFISFNITCAAI